MKLRLAVILALALALLPGVVSAQEPNDDDPGIIGAIGRDLTLATGDTATGVVVIDGNARIDGTVEDFVLVIHGDLTVAGQVQGDITVINGTVTLLDGSTVKDVSLVDSTLDAAPASHVTGTTDERGRFVFEGFGAALSIYFWLSFTVIMLAAVLLFAAIGGSQLRRAATTLTAEPGKTVVAALVLWIGLPIVAILALITIVGIPLGLTMFFAIPVLWILGYLVAGTRLGAWLMSLTGRPMGEHPYLAGVIGVFLLQLLTWVPVVGWLLVSIAGLWGAGAVVLTAARAVRRRPDALASESLPAPMA